MDDPQSLSRNDLRFPSHAVKVLRDWFESHADYPYPTKNEKADLKAKTALSPSQIANWLSNARRRRKASNRPRPRAGESPRPPPTSAIDIPVTRKPWEELNPFERWKNSPPEDDPATISDIVKAAAVDALHDEWRSTLREPTRSHGDSSSGSLWSKPRAPSTDSAVSGRTPSIYAPTSAILSSHSSRSTRGSFGSFRIGGTNKRDFQTFIRPNSSNSTHGLFGSFRSTPTNKRNGRRRRRMDARDATGIDIGAIPKRVFQCTFCTDTFKSKHDWTRHEKSLHLSLEKWVCAPLGPITIDQDSEMKQCIYCGLHEPSDEHIQMHNHSECEDKGLEARTFSRKDHLKQHLRHVHCCELLPWMNRWKSSVTSINSRCGFCAQGFTTWDERVNHLTDHFKAGAKMSEWKGCRGFDPEIAAQVTNAMAPWVIGMEAMSKHPFSATNQASWPLGDENFDRIGNNAKGASLIGDGITYEKLTCFDILTFRLIQYARAHTDQGLVLTDEMLQQWAREIMYGSDDPWNQTVADNTEWLDIFKRAHGLDLASDLMRGQSFKLPEDIFVIEADSVSNPQNGGSSIQSTGSNRIEQRSPDEEGKCATSNTTWVMKGSHALKNEDRAWWITSKLHGSQSCYQDLELQLNAEKSSTAHESTIHDHDEVHCSCFAEIRTRFPNTFMQRDDTFAFSRRPNQRLISYRSQVSSTTTSYLPPIPGGGQLPQYQYESFWDTFWPLMCSTGVWPQYPVTPQVVDTSMLYIGQTNDVIPDGPMDYCGGDLRDSQTFMDGLLAADIHLPSVAAIGDDDVTQGETSELVYPMDLSMDKTYNFGNISTVDTWPAYF